MIFEKGYKQFMAVCQLLFSNQEAQAKAKVEEMVLDKLDVNTSNEALLAHMIAASLLKRIDRELLESKNIYLQQFDIPQIVLFYKMAEAYPQVAASHHLANQYLESVLIKRDEGTIFDIGIGKGKQVESLLSQISKKENHLKQVNVIGLDPDAANLNDCKVLFEGLNDKLSFKVSYYPIQKLLEDFNDGDYATIRSIGNGAILMNSSYAMHHVWHQLHDNNRRTEIFRNLKALNPLIFTLVEPNSDHDNENLQKRLHNCWLHYGTVFQLVDESNIDAEHKFVVKEKFFGREIKDIFGTSDYLRCERHETSESWMFRLAKANFTPYACGDIGIKLPDYCEQKVSEGFVQLGYQSTPLIGIFAYI